MHIVNRHTNYKDQSDKSYGYIPYGAIPILFEYHEVIQCIHHREDARQT